MEFEGEFGDFDENWNLVLEFAFCFPDWFLRGNVIVLLYYNQSRSLCREDILRHLYPTQIRTVSLQSREFDVALSRWKDFSLV